MELGGETAGGLRVGDVMARGERLGAEVTGVHPCDDWKVSRRANRWKAT